MRLLDGGLKLFLFTALSLVSWVTAQSLPCIVAVTAKIKNDETLQSARFPCLVGGFGAQAETAPALLVQAHPFNACDALDNTNTPHDTNWIALATRQRNCSFFQKTLNAQSAGAIATLIGNNIPDGGPVLMDSNEGTTAIPAYSIGYDGRNYLMSLIDTYHGTDTQLWVTVSLQERSPVASTFEPLAKQFFLFFLPTLLGALFLLCAVLSFILAYRRQRLTTMRADITMLSPIDAMTIRSEREHMLSRLPVVPYVKPKAEDDPSQGGIYCTGCAICLDDFEPDDMVRQLPCQHVYHQSCIDQWLLDKGMCPYCKMDFITGEFPQEKRRVSRTLSEAQRPPPHDSSHVVDIDSYSTENATRRNSIELRPTSV